MNRMTRSISDILTVLYDKRGFKNLYVLSANTISIVCEGIVTTVSSGVPTKLVGHVGSPIRVNYQTPNINVDIICTNEDL